MFKKLGLVVAAAAIMFSAGLGLATSASAQTPPATFYGKGLKSGPLMRGFCMGVREADLRLGT